MLASMQETPHERQYFSCDRASGTHCGDTVPGANRLDSAKRVWVDKSGARGWQCVFCHSGPYASIPWFETQRYEVGKTSQRALRRPEGSPWGSRTRVGHEEAPKGMKADALPRRRAWKSPAGRAPYSQRSPRYGDRMGGTP